MRNALWPLASFDSAELSLEGSGGRKAVGNGVGVGECFNFDGFHLGDSDRPNVWDVAPLAGAHVAELPQPDGLGFFATTDGVEELFLEEEHRGMVAD